MSDYTIVSAQEMKRITATGETILDVRQPGEHDEQHLLATHAFVPLDQLVPKDFMLRRGLTSEAPVYLLCRSGMRARKAADMFAGAGYKNLFVIEGGILACVAAGIPVSGATSAASSALPPTKIISLERQVRIAAGALVALGVVLGHFVHPVFYLLSFGVGAGLVYAGVTDKCGMALVLLKAPWNKSVKNCSGLPQTPSAPTTGGCA